MNFLSLSLALFFFYLHSIPFFSPSSSLDLMWASFVTAFADQKWYGTQEGEFSSSVMQVCTAFTDVY